MKNQYSYLSQLTTEIEITFNGPWETMPTTEWETNNNNRVCVCVRVCVCARVCVCVKTKCLKHLLGRFLLHGLVQNDFCLHCFVSFVVLVLLHTVMLIVV